MTAVLNLPSSFTRSVTVAAVITLSGMGALAQAPSTPARPTDQGESSSLADAPSPAAPGRALPPSSLRPSGNASTSGQVTVLEDTMIRVMTAAPLNSKRVEQDTPVLLTVSEDVVVDGALVIPRGATVHGVVLKSKKAGVLTGSPELTLKLVSLDLGDKNYPLYTYQFKVTGTSKTPATETKALVGAYAGAIAGSFGVSQKSGVQTSSDPGRAVSMTAGAAVGAGVGTLVSAATPGPGIWLPSESQIDFFLASPVTIAPLSAKEAARLSEGLHAGGPVLYVRGETP